MGDKTAISWTDATWNPLRGCTRVSEGCRNCYAEKVAHRFSGPGKPYEGLTTDRGRWNGKIKLVPDKLDQPLRWTKPRMVFVNSMSDLFHPDVPNEYIAAVFGVMAAAPQHTFQVLTKRPERAREWFGWYEGKSGAGASPWAARHAALEALGRDQHRLGLDTHPPWPLPNVWLGCSVEDQVTADERIPVLLGLPAAVRWVSYEPALGPVNFGLLGTRPKAWGTGYGPVADLLRWIVIGGESGPGARPFDVAWARNTIEQCREAGVSCFVKQGGAAPHDGERRLRLKDRKGGDLSELPDGLNVREWPGR